MQIEQTVYGYTRHTHTQAGSDLKHKTSEQTHTRPEMDRYSLDLIRDATHDPMCVYLFDGGIRIPIVQCSVSSPADGTLHTQRHTLTSPVQSSPDGTLYVCTSTLETLSRNSLSVQSAWHRLSRHAEPILLGYFIFIRRVLYCKVRSKYGVYRRLPVRNTITLLLLRTT